MGTLRAGTAVTPGPTRGAMTRVSIEGFVNASALSGGTRPQVTARPGARIRSSPSTGARVVADLAGGAPLVRVSKRGEWIRVRGTGWVQRALLATTPVKPAPPSVASSTSRRTTPARTRVATSSGAVASQPRPRTAPATPVPAARSPATPPRLAAEVDVDTSGPVLTPARATPLADAPEGHPLARLEPGAKMTPLARERGWVRVRVEGWVLERDATAADSLLRAELSAADLRADPEGTRGRVVRWDVQVLAFQTADPLRRDMAPDEPYLLARGPGTENALLYLALPPSLVESARTLPSLSSVTVTARVRKGRSEPVGVPILDLQSLARR